MKKIFSILLVIFLGGSNMTLPSYGDTPDYGKTLSSSPTSQSFDTGEDTTRLLMGGGANSRTGRWLWATGFESGLAEFSPVAIGTGRAVISTSNVFMGKQSLNFNASVLNDVATFNKYLFTPIIPGAANNRFGFELMAAFSIVNQPFELRWLLTVPDIDNITQTVAFRIVLVVTANYAGNLYVENGGIRTLFANVNSYLWDQATLFHYSKLVVDAGTKNYVKFTFDNVTYDLSAFPGVVGAASAPALWIQAAYTNKSNVLTNMWIDNVIATADEP